MNDEGVPVSDNGPASPDGRPGPGEDDRSIVGRAGPGGTGAGGPLHGVGSGEGRETQRRDGFRARVIAAVDQIGPLCAGIDPSSDLLARWGLPDNASGLREFSARCLEAFGGVAPVLKYQVAFFERHGAEGIKVLEEVIGSARTSGSIVIADAKRGDIGSTAAAYAEAWLDQSSPLCSDAVTAVPYMGLGALAPMFDRALSMGGGVIVVVRSSNPEGRWLQTARVAGVAPAAGEGSRAGAEPDRRSSAEPDHGRSGAGAHAVEDALLASIAELNRASAGAGHVGAVVGATLAPSEFPLASLGGIVLSPGFGVQGGTASHLARLFGGCPPGTVLANVSRSLLDAGPDIAPLRARAIDMRDEITAALSGARD